MCVCGGGGGGGGCGLMSPERHGGERGEKSLRVGESTSVGGWVLWWNLNL